MDTALVKLFPVIIVLLTVAINPCLVVKTGSIDFEGMFFNNNLQNKALKYKTYQKAGLPCIQLSDYQSSFSLGVVKEGKSNLIKVSLKIYIDSSTVQDKYAVIHYKDPNSSKKYLGAVIDLHKIKKNEWTVIELFVPDFDSFSKSTIHFSRDTWFSHGIGQQTTFDVRGVSLIQGIYINSIKIDNQLKNTLLKLPESKVLLYFKEYFLLASVFVLSSFLLLSRFYLYFLICFCLSSLSLLGLLFFPAMGSDILLDQEDQYVAQIESEARGHLYRISGLQKKYEFTLSTLLKTFNEEAKELVNKNIKTKSSTDIWRSSLQKLITNSSKQTKLKYWLCTSKDVYNDGSKRNKNTKVAFKDFIRLLFPIIEGKVMERKDSNPLEKDRYRTKVKVFKDFIESAFDNSDFLQNFLTNPNRLFRMSTGSVNTSKEMDQSMWSYFVDNKGEFWLVFAQVQAQVIVSEYSKEVAQYEKTHDELDLQLYYSKNLYSFPHKIYSSDFSKIIARSMATSEVSLNYAKSNEQNYYYASIKHPNQSNVYVAIRMAMDPYIERYKAFLIEKEYSLLFMIIGLLLLSYILNYFIRLPIYRLSKSIDLILSNNNFYLQTLGFGQFRELESVIVQQNEHFEKQKLLTSLQQKDFSKFDDIAGIIGLVNHSIHPFSPSLSKRARCAKHIKNEVYLYIYPKEDLHYLLDKNFTILMDCSEFEAQKIAYLNDEDPIFSDSNLTYVSSKIYECTSECSKITSECFEGDFYGLP